MGSSRRPTLIALLVFSFVLPLLGCGGEEEMIESATTTAIREKVRADMENERLERIDDACPSPARSSHYPEERGHRHRPHCREACAK